MQMTKIFPHLAVLLLFATTSAFANNVTISGVFNGDEPTMAASVASCDNVAKRYKVAGSITVSESGGYQVVDAGNWFPFVLPQGSIADAVIVIYSNSFDSANPATNRVATVDEFDSVQLNAGTTYVLVVQHWCVEINGAYAIVIDGAQKTISGDGFTSLPRTIGNFDSASPTASFSDQPGGVRRYKSEPVTVSESGTYYLIDIGEELGGSTMSLRIYEGSFDPLDTDKNLHFTTAGFFASAISLKAGVNYVFVLYENVFNSGRLQYVLFPPGPSNFNPGLNGAWVAPGIEHQGILMEVLPSAGILFMAQFTFVDQLTTSTQSTSRSTVQTTGGGDSKVQTHLGADDQRWLTAFGSIPADGERMTISFENSTGGRFNSETPIATTDSSYGSGWIDLMACDHLLINWDLPGGIVDTRDYYKATQDAVPYCESFIKAGPVTPNW